MFKRKHTASSDTVYEALKEDILHLVLPPGAAISEIDTAESFHISRTPVRDAFKRLEREGLLDIRPHIGTFISLIDLDAISDILYIREVLECTTLTNLIPVYGEALDLQVQALLQKQKELLESDMSPEELGRAFLLADHEFHNALFAAAGKPNIPKYLNQLNYQYERFRTYINFSGKSDLRKLYHSHVAIAEQIRQKDAEGLKQVIHYHLYDGFQSSSHIIRNHPEFFKDKQWKNIL
uniref:GntR family transcriptional regulator n=1 Tax=Agathobacter sp. TaxID=2021311 RepID=UPI004056F2C2